MQRVIRLREHGTLRGVALDAREVALLADPRARIRVLARPDDKFDVEASEVVGTLAGRSTRVIIEPKLSIRRLFFLLGFSLGGPKFGGATLAGEEPDALSAMVVTYAEALSTALRDGPVSTYELVRDDLPAPRGRVDWLNLGARRFGVFPPLDCEYDEFTPDNPANRHLLAAATMLLATRAGSQAARARLASLRQRLADVRDDRTRATPSVPSNDRRFHRYAAATALASVVLRNGSVEMRDGTVDSIAMLVDMNALFEDFIAEGLREAISEPTSRWSRKPRGLWFDEGNRLQLLPDVVWRDSSGVARLVIDVKYKAVVAPRNDDVYQVAAYCQALRLARGALIYAAAQDDVVIVRNGGPAITVISVDPDGEPDDLRKRLRAAADRLRALAV